MKFKDEYAQYSDCLNRLPFFSFPADWQVQIMPQLVALIRFRVRKGGKTVSVYFDPDQSLGFFGGPYWEIYPDKDGNNDRFAEHDIEGLIRGIEEALK